MYSQSNTKTRRFPQSQSKNLGKLLKAALVDGFKISVSDKTWWWHKVTMRHSSGSGEIARCFSFEHMLFEQQRLDKKGFALLHARGVLQVGVA